MMEQVKKYSYEDFLQIIARLRGENGCPWDKVQTHETLKPCMMEEAAELLASIRIYEKTGNAENMREELGDVLLQVVMHAQIADEEGLFTMEDVVDEVARKMVRRHPHIFGSAVADTPEQVLVNWEEIKKEEKKDKTWAKSPLRDIPQELPALTRATKIFKKVDKLYEPGRSYDENIDILQKTLDAMKKSKPEAYDKQLERQLTDILLSVSEIAREFKISQEQALNDALEDIIDKYEPQVKNSF